MKKTLLCLCLLVLVISSWSVEIQIGNGTNFEKNVPLKPSRNYSMSQTIYHQYDINIEGQKIESIKYAYVGNEDWIEDNVNVYLGHTNKSVFNSNNDWIPLEDLNLVFSGSVEFIFANWCEISFDTPFPYNNIDNLVVAIEDNSAGLTYTSNDFLSTYNSTSFNRTIYQYSNNVNGDFSNAPTGIVTNYSPNIKFQFSTCTELPQLYTYPSNFDWNNVMLDGYIEPLTVSIMNVGVENLEIEDISLEGNDCFTLATELDLPYLFVDDNLHINVVFFPQTAGSFNSKLDITFNNNETKSIFFTGNAIDPTIYEDQYYESFDNTPLLGIPEYWTSTINSSNFETSIAISNIYYYNMYGVSFKQKDDPNAEMFLFTPPVNDLTDKRIRLMAKSAELSSKLVIGTADKNHGDFTFTPRDTLLFNCGFEEYYHEFSNMTNNDHYIAFKYEREPAYNFLIIDDFYLETIPNAPIFNLELGDYGFNPGSYYCGYVPMNRTGNTFLVVHNSGNSNLSLELNSLSDNFQVTNEEIIIEPKDKKLVEVLFTPTSLGDKVGSIEISTNDPNIPLKTIFPEGVAIQADPENVSTVRGHNNQFNCGWDDKTYNQGIYYPGEIGHPSAMIEELAFQLYDDYSTPSTMDIQIFMGYTDKYYFNNSNDWIDIDELMEVYNGTFTQNINLEWQNLELTTPFPYDDSQNLVIALYCEIEDQFSMDYRWKASSNNQLIKSIECIERGNTVVDITNPPTAVFIKPHTVDHRFKFAPIPESPQLVINNFNCEFEDIETNQAYEEKLVTVRSTGQLTAIVYTPPVIYGEDAENFTITTDNNSYPYLLPYNERVTYGITFTPTSEGYKEATFQIYDGETREIVEVQISGLALAPTDNSDSDVAAFVTKLGSNYPNPFNPETTINYSLKDARNVEINIYNIKGQKVKTLVNDFREAGNHTVVWNGKDNNNNKVASGVYLYQMKSKKLTSTKKMILMK